MSDDEIKLRLRAEIAVCNESAKEFPLHGFDKLGEVFARSLARIEELEAERPDAARRKELADSFERWATTWWKQANNTQCREVLAYLRGEK